MNTVFLKLTSAIVVAGQVIPASTPAHISLVEVTEHEARDLLNRGKGVLATDADMKRAGMVASTETVEAPLHPDIEAHQTDRKEQASEREGDAAPAVAAKSAAISSEPASARKGRKPAGPAT